MQSMPTRHVHRYKRKGTAAVVEAAQLTEDNASEISNWAGGAQVVEEGVSHSDEVMEGLNIKTPDGFRRASRGMFVIKFNEQFYVGQPGKFAETYELIPE